MPSDQGLLVSCWSEGSALGSYPGFAARDAKHDAARIVDARGEVGDVAWEVRDRARRDGRRIERRIVSRTLLIKGLEFDQAIVLNADELDAKNLYVVAKVLAFLEV
jgi:hypothetical protein